MTKRRLLLSVLAVLFVVVPLVEVVVLIRVGRVIGPWWTVGLLVLDGLLGAWLLRRQGAAAWQALVQALNSGRMPAAELADAALILIGGVLMLTPGFVTDLAGVFLILPLTRPLARRMLTAAVRRRLGPLGSVGRTGVPDEESVVRGEVVED